MFIVDATKPFASRPRCLEEEAHIRFGSKRMSRH